MNEQLLARLQDRLGAVNREYQAFRRQMDVLLRDAVELCKDTAECVVIDPQTDVSHRNKITIPKG